MNWSIRIVLILVISSGLVWLNWDRFSEESMASKTLEEGIEQVEAPRTTQKLNQEQNKEALGRVLRHEGLAENFDLKPASPKKPDFVLKPSPESLDESDTQVREVAVEISPDVIEWLQPQEQLRKLTLLFTQAAEGKILYQDRPFMFNLPEFAVEERNARYFISTQNFRHYETVVSVLNAMPVDKLVAYYRSWYPLLEQAFGELGLPGSFDEQVDSVIERILAVEILMPPIELKKPTSVTYKFLDPTLEGASQIDKLLWRMGPENAKQIQGLAYRIKEALQEPR